MESHTIYSLLLLVVLCMKKADIKSQVARQTSLGNIKTGQEGTDALNGNPSETAWTDHLAISSNYEKHIYLKPLDQVFAGFSRGKENRAMSVTFYGTGDHRLSKNRYAIQYGQLFSNKFALGLRINASHYSFSETYGSAVFVHADFGFSMQIKDNLKLGFVAENLGKSLLIRAFNERLPNALITGLGFRCSEITCLHIELEKRSHDPLNVKLGIDYEVHPDVALRCGFQSTHRLYSAGFGLRILKLKIETAVSYNEPLGYRLSTGLIIDFGSSEDR